MSGQNMWDQDRRPNSTLGPRQTQSIDENCLVEESFFNYVATVLHTLNLLSRFGHVKAIFTAGSVLSYVMLRIWWTGWPGKPNTFEIFQPPLNTPWVQQLLSKLRLHERRFILPSPGTGRRFVDPCSTTCSLQVLSIVTTS